MLLFGWSRNFHATLTNRSSQQALDSGNLSPGGLITEGTSGSTGISLAMVARAQGLNCYVSLPDDAAVEKAQVLEALGADVERVSACSLHLLR